MDQNQFAQMMMKKKGTHPCPEHLQWTRQIAADGIVLLKNEKNVLPLSVGQKIALFGAGAVDTVTCGTGSGYVSAPYVVSIREGLGKAGMAITSDAWLDRFAAAKQKANDEDTTLSPIARMWSGVSILIDETEVTPEDIAAAREAQTAVYAIRRNAGEGGDRRNVKGDYSLSDTERKNLELIAASFVHTVVLFNTCRLHRRNPGDRCRAFCQYGRRGNRKCRCRCTDGESQSQRPPDGYLGQTVRRLSGVRHLQRQ